MQQGIASTAYRYTLCNPNERKRLTVILYSSANGDVRWLARFSCCLKMLLCWRRHSTLTWAGRGNACRRRWRSASQPAWQLLQPRRLTPLWTRSFKQ